MAIESNLDNSLGRSGEGVIQSTSRKWLENSATERSNSGRQYFGSSLVDRQVSATSTGHQGRHSGSAFASHSVLEHVRQAAGAAVQRKITYLPQTFGSFKRLAMRAA